MDDHGLYVATLIDASARALAAGAVTRRNELLGARLAPEEGSFRGSLGEVEARLVNLAEALAAGSPALFVMHVAWLRDTYLARGVPLEGLVAELECLGAELRESLPAAAHAALETALAPALAEARATPAPQATPIEEGGPQARLTRLFLVHALEGRREEALELVTRAVDDGVPLGELQVEVLARVQRETGLMWQRGELQVAEERLCSEVVAEALTLLRTRIPRAPDDAPRAVVAAVDGNAHALGARVVSDQLALAGWRTLFLGADAPAQDVAWALATFGARLAVLSASLPRHVRATARLVRELRAAREDAVVLVGGGPFADVPELWRAVGADGCTRDAADVPAEAARLCARS